MSRKTKIVCTIGPASESHEMLTQLIQAGMNVARLNFSHGNYTEFKEIIKNIRAISTKLNKNVAVLQDLQGLKIRVGELKRNPYVLTMGDKVVFTVAKQYQEDEIPVQYEGFIKDIQKGERVLLADGTIELMVLSKTRDRAILQVVHGGSILSHKGINIPDTSVAASPLTKKDKEDIRFGIAQKVHFMGLSFVKRKQDILELRNYLDRNGGRHIKIIAKIERKEALTNLDEIIQAADGVMVARGDLGVELSFEKVPLIQKEIIHLARRHGKPVITATQMLMSMIVSPVPTRAEVSDIANAVLDHTDALMLSDETAMGKFPLQAVEVMHKTALEIEEKFHFKQAFWEGRKAESVVDPIAVAYNAIQLATDVKARYLLVFTVHGFTAQQIARFRPSIPVMVVTVSQEVKHQLALSYGLNDIYVFPTLKNKTQVLIPMLLREKKVKQGDTIVTVSVAKQRAEGIMDDITVFRIQ